MRGSIVERKVPSGKLYYVVLAFSSKRKWIKGGKTKKQAERVLAEELNRALSGPYKKISKIRFPEFSEKWLAEYAKPKVSDNTYLDYESSIRVHIDPYFKDFTLDSITLQDCQRFVNKLITDGILSAKTICNIVVPLKEMFKHGARWGYLRENPALYVEKPKVPRPEMDFLNAEEVGKLLKEIPQEYYALFLMAVVTGLRRSELLGAKWANLDWNRKQYFVKEQLDKDDSFTEPKTPYSKAPVDLTPKLLEALEKHSAAQAKQKLALGPELPRSRPYLLPNRWQTVRRRASGSKSFREGFEACWHPNNPVS